jgi:hypothetical protein
MIKSAGIDKTDIVNNSDALLDVLKFQDDFNKQRSQSVYGMAPIYATQTTPQQQPGAGAGMTTTAPNAGTTAAHPVATPPAAQVAATPETQANPSSAPMPSGPSNLSLRDLVGNASNRELYRNPKKIGEGCV